MATELDKLEAELKRKMGIRDSQDNEYKKFCILTDFPSIEFLLFKAILLKHLPDQKLRQYYLTKALLRPNNTNYGYVLGCVAVHQFGDNDVNKAIEIISSIVSFDKEEAADAFVNLACAIRCSNDCTKFSNKTEQIRRLTSLALLTCPDNKNSNRADAIADLNKVVEQSGERLTSKPILAKL